MRIGQGKKGDRRPGRRPAARAPGRAPLLLALLAPALAGQSCMVKSRCQADYDCSSMETCDPYTGSCIVECTDDLDCLVNGVNLGKRCIDNRCEFLFDERVAAPDFCLEVVNPSSEYFGQDYCLDQQQGKVVMIYFGLLA